MELATNLEDEFGYLNKWMFLVQKEHKTVILVQGENCTCIAKLAPQTATARPANRRGNGSFLPIFACCPYEFRTLGLLCLRQLIPYILNLTTQISHHTLLTNRRNAQTLAHLL